MSYEQFQNMVQGAHLKAVDLNTTPLHSIYTNKMEHKNDANTNSTNQSSKFHLLPTQTHQFISITQQQKEKENQRRSDALLNECTRSTLTIIPQSSHEFMAAWKRLVSTSSTSDPIELNHRKWEFLRTIPTDQWGNLMKGGNGLENLGDILSVLHAGITIETAHGSTEFKNNDINQIDANQAFDLLEALSRIERFSMTVGFLNSKEKTYTNEIMNWFEKQKEESEITKTLYTMERIDKLRQTYKSIKQANADCR
jgi:hypothetical protein